MADILTMPNGDQYSVPGFDAMTPEQQHQRQVQIGEAVMAQERQSRVDTARGKLVHNTDQRLPRMTTPGTTMGNIAEGFDALGRGMTGGLSDLASAGASYLPWLEGPMTDDMDFWERRDAIRGSHDFQQDRAGVDYVETLGNIIPATTLANTVAPTVSAAGRAVAAGPGVVMGPKAATKAGAIEGSVHGAGQSEARSPEGLALDTGVGAGVGGASTMLADAFLDKVIGGSVRKGLARPDGESGKLYDQQVELGMKPSAGSVGGPTAASLENALAESPLSAAFSAATPWRSARQAQQGQRDVVENTMGPRVTNPMRGGKQGPQTDAELQEDIIGYANTGIDKAKQNIKDSEAIVDNMVPAGTPVDTRPIQAVAPKSKAAHDSDQYVKEAEKTAEFMRGKPSRRMAHDPAKDAQWAKKQGKLEGEIDAANKQLANLDPADPQAKRLNKTITTKQKAVDVLQGHRDRNMGTAWNTVRQNRTEVGKRAAQAPGTKKKISGNVADKFYPEITKSLRATAEKTRKGGGSEFDTQMAVEKEMYRLIGVKKDFADKNAASRVGPKIRRAVVKGDWRDIDDLAAEIPVGDQKEFQAGLIDMLGRTSAQEGFNPGTFAKQWKRVPPEALDRLFKGNPEGRQIAQSLAEVTEAMAERGTLSGHSNTASMAGVVAGVAAGVADPSKIIPFLATISGMDKVLVSEAVAKAIAGKPTGLGQIIRKGVMTASGTNAEEILREVQQQMPQTEGPQ